MKYVLFIQLIILFSEAVQGAPPLPISLGKFGCTHAAFCNLVKFQENSDEISLLISSFSGNPFSKDTVYIVYNITNDIDSVSTIKPEIFTQKITWPNEATGVPNDVFNNTNTVVVSGGFLPPGKQNGVVSLFTVDDKKGEATGPYQISQDKKDWFYHTALWWDMDNDGLLDCVTARAYVPMFGDPQGNLLWYKQPSSSHLDGEWDEFVIGDGPDVFIQFIQLEGSSTIQIIAAQFFSQKLSIWWTNSTWEDVSSVQSRVIDDTLGSAFDLQVFDVNADGKLDLLVTNHENNATFSSLYAYTIPDDWQSDPWPRYTLTNNITTLVPGNNQASPGAATAFYPNIHNSNGKPLIIMAGDGSEEAYLVSANSESPDDWSYTRQTIVNTGSTVGQIAVGDVDGDGWVEAFIPSYDNSMIYVYSFSNYATLIEKNN